MLLPPLALVAAVTSTITTAAATEDFVRQEVRPAEREEAANAERLRREGHVGRKDAEARLRAACAQTTQAARREALGGAQTPQTCQDATSRSAVRGGQRGR